MDYKELVRIVKQGEGLHIEFKLKTNHPEKIIREIVAFANTAGGYLLVGIDDTGQIKGLKNPQGDRYVLEKAIATQCIPAIHYTLTSVQVGNDQEVLVYYIHTSEDKPYCVINQEGHKKAYVRIADKSVQASREMYQVMRQARRRNVKFVYGEKEQQLMKILETQGMITVDEYAAKANLSKSIASKTLVLLVLANVLEIHPHESTDWFTRREVEYS